MSPQTVLNYFDVTIEFLSAVVLENPSLRGMLLGYLAEAKLREILEGHGRGTAYRKDDDHDRKKKGDLVITYQGREFRVEVKSLQTHTVEIAEDGTWLRKIKSQRGRGVENPNYAPVWESIRDTARYRGQFQCDASDRRKVRFDDESVVETTNLHVGEFDIVAAGLFAFRHRWDFGFALNADLPRSANPAYTPYQRERLLRSMVPITWPLADPFTDDLYALLDRLIAEPERPVAEIAVIRDSGGTGSVATDSTAKPVGKKRGKKS